MAKVAKPISSAFPSSSPPLFSVGEVDFSSLLSTSSSSIDSKVFTSADVSLHNTEEDAWVIFEGNVFDITEFLEDHPGGKEILFPFLGKDMTEAFYDVGHSILATRILYEKCFIGTLDMIQPTNNNSNNKKTSSDNSSIRNNSISSDSFHDDLVEVLQNTVDVEVSEKRRVTTTRRRLVVEEEETTSKISSKGKDNINSKNNNSSDTALRSSFETFTDDEEETKNSISLDKNAAETSFFSSSSVDMSWNSVKNHPIIDFREALVPQVFRLNRENYKAVVNHPILSNQVMRLFPYAWMEKLSKTYWWVVPLLWLPVALGLFLYGRYIQMIPLWLSIFCWMVGVLIWTFMEYTIHRFVFHLDEDFLPNNGYVFVLHFLAHSVHHMLPMDPLRLVMPPFLFIFLCTPFFFLFYSFVPNFLLFTGWSGAVSGYIIYDMIHYSTHHFTFSEMIPHVKEMKRYHMKHHYKLPERGFGVSSKLWDHFFDTLID